MPAVGVRQTSGSQGAGLLEPSTAPSRPLCSVPSPAPFTLAEPGGGPSSRPRSPLSSFQQQQLAGPAAQTPASPHRPLPRGAAAPGKEGAGGLGDPETTSWAPRPRPSLASAARACHLGLSSSPPLRPPGAKPQAWSPRVPVPWLSPPWAPCAGQTLPGVPRLSPPSLPVPAPEPNPKLAAKLAPPARCPPLTGGKGRCARAQSPRRPPPAQRMSRRPAPRSGASVLAWRAPEARRRGAGARGAAWRAEPGPPPRPAPLSWPGARPAPSRAGLRAAPPAPGARQPAVAERTAPPAWPAPPGPAASAPPRPAPAGPPRRRHPRSSRPLLAGPRARRLSPFSPLRDCFPRPDTRGQVWPQKKQPARSSEFEPQLTSCVTLGLLISRTPQSTKWSQHLGDWHKRQ